MSGTPLSLAKQRCACDHEQMHKGFAENWSRWWSYLGTERDRVFWHEYVASQYGKICTNPNAYTAETLDSLHEDVALVMRVRNVDYSTLVSPSAKNRLDDRWNKC